MTILERYADERAAKRLDGRYREVLPGELPPACRSCGANMCHSYQYGSGWANNSAHGLCDGRFGCGAMHDEVFAGVAALALETTPPLGAARLAAMWAEEAALERGRRFPAPKSEQPRRFT